MNDTPSSSLDFKQRGMRLAGDIINLIRAAAQESVQGYQAPSRLKANSTITAWHQTQLHLNTVMLCKIVGSALDMAEKEELTSLAVSARIPTLISGQSHEVIGEDVSITRICSKPAARFSKDKLIHAMLRYGVPKPTVYNIIDDRTFLGASVQSDRVRFTSEADLAKAAIQDSTDLGPEA